MGLFDLFGLGDTFDYDGDGKTGLWDAFVALEWFNIYNEYCNLKEELISLFSLFSFSDSSVLFSGTTFYEKALPY